MNTATTYDAPRDVAHLTERCMLRLAEHLERVIDACSNLDKPGNVNATLRAVSLLVRLYTSIRTRRAVAPDRPPSRVAAPAPEAPVPAGVDQAEPLHASDAEPAPTPVEAAPFSTLAIWPLPPLQPVGRAAPTPAALLAARAGLAMGPGP